MHHVQLVSILYEHGIPGVKFHYLTGGDRTLSDEQAVKFIELVENERNHQEGIDVIPVSLIRKYIADRYFC